MEKFPQQIQPKKIELPKDIRDAIYRREEFDYGTKDCDERRIDRIEKWLLNANTKEELDEILGLLQRHCYEHIGDEGGGGEAVDILGEVLKNILFKKQTKTE